jgi:hypothetical protein
MENDETYAYRGIDRLALFSELFVRREQEH